MDKIGFFKSLGVLAVSLLIPTDKILAATDFVEKKADPAEIELPSTKYPEEITIHWKFNIQT